MSTKKRVMIGTVTLVLLTLVCLLPHADPTRVDLAHEFAPVSMAHPMGTDDLGRDLWALFATGYWRSLLVVLTTSLTSIVIGIPTGLVAGYVGGPIDALITTVTDLTMVVPSFIAALLVTSVVGLTPVTAGIVLGNFGAGAYVNQARALAHELTLRPYVESEILFGTRTTTILVRHILPGMVAPIGSYFGATASGAVLAYAGLAFIGLGVDSTVPDWGTMLYQYRTQVDHPMLLICPGLGIFVLAVVFQLVFDGSSRQDADV